MERVYLNLNPGFSVIEVLNQETKVLIGLDEKNFMQMILKKSSFQCHLYGNVPDCQNRLNLYDWVLVSNGKPYCHGAQNELIANMKARTALKTAARLQATSNPMVQ